MYNKIVDVYSLRTKDPVYGYCLAASIDRIFSTKSIGVYGWVKYKSGGGCMKKKEVVSFRWPKRPKRPREIRKLEKLREPKKTKEPKKAKEPNKSK